MNKLQQTLKNIKNKKIGIMAHTVVGYPSLAETIATVKTMAQSGVDIVELQIPFSDPLADGATIMKACEESLANGTKVSDAFVIMKKLSREVSIPLIFMCYYNTVFAYGVKKFCKDAKDAGVSGLIVPDMPIDEESEEGFYAACKKYDLYTIQVVAPSSTYTRLRKNATIANGFVYATARQGTTGARDSLDPQIIAYLKKVKNVFDLPVAVGFGISKREHLQLLSGTADIAIVGSAVIDVIKKSGKNNVQENIRRFFKEIMVQ